MTQGYDDTDDDDDAAGKESLSKCLFLAPTPPPLELNYLSAAVDAPL